MDGKEELEKENKEGEGGKPLTDQKPSATQSAGVCDRAKLGSREVAFAGTLGVSVSPQKPLQKPSVRLNGPHTQTHNSSI